MEITDIFCVLMQKNERIGRPFLFSFSRRVQLITVFIEKVTLDKGNTWGQEC